MSSPFPGMDPYLEVSGLFEDFHAKFINYWQEALADALPAHYEARMREKVYLIQHDPDDQVIAKRIEPDVAVLARGDTGTPTEPGGVATLEPITIPLIFPDTTRETYIEILHRPDRSLVTVLELLSPSNKDSRGEPLYEEKRHAVFVQDVHLFELDLLLGGRRLRFRRPLPAGDYYAMLSRADKRPLCDVYSWTVRDHLPQLPIPLRRPDPDVQIDLQAVFETTFERGRYARSIDYAAEFTGPVDEDTRRWIEQRATGDG